MKNRKVYIPVILIIVFLVVIGGLWYRNYNKYISSDDAYVDGDNVSVSSKIMGRIVAIYAEEGDSIKKGKLLVQLDSTDLLAQKNQLLAARGQAMAMKSQSEAKYNSDQEGIVVLKINLEKAQNDYDRAKKQFEGNVITAEQYDHMQKAYEVAKAQYEASNSQLSVSQAQISSSAASVKTSQAQIGVIETQLNNTKLCAPTDAVVAKKWLMPGDIVQPGQSVLTLNCDNDHWILVQLEETKIGKLHIGQKALINIDSYPGKKLTGHIIYIGTSTSSQFSLIPPSNASGNFTKITQRVPIKISIDGIDGSDAKDYTRLLTGMSAEVKIIKD